MKELGKEKGVSKLSYSKKHKALTFKSQGFAMSKTFVTSDHRKFQL